MAAATDLTHRAGELRRAFDRAFAEPPAMGEALPEVDLLACRIGSEPYAIRLAEVAGLHVDRRVTRLPGGPAAQLGVAGFRGAVLPVYDLASLLGHAAAAGPRWLVIAAGAPVAFAFTTFDFHLRVEPASIVAQDMSGTGPGSSGRHVREFVRDRGTIRPIVHLPSIVEAIRGGMPPSGSR